MKDQPVPLASPASYAAIFAALPDAVFVQDGDGRFLDVNDAACRAYGYPRSALVGATLDLLAAPDRFDPAVARRSLRRALAGEAQRFRWWGRRSDGTEFPQDVSLGRVVHEGSELIVAVARDDTARHEVARQLRESEARFRTLVEQAPVGIIIRRGTGYVYANTAAREMVGLTGGDRDREISVLEMVAPECRAEIAERMRRRAAGDPEPTIYDTLGLRADGTVFPVHVVVAPIQLADGPGTLGFITDESERLATEEQRRQGQRLEAIGRLAGGVAHDFNNLLTAILSYSSMILCEVPEGSPIREDVEQIRSAGERAATLTRQLLAFGRRQHLEPKPVAMNAVVSDLERMLRRMIGEDVELVTELAPELGTVFADRGQLEQVLMNLVVNARDAMPDGGMVCIATANILVSAQDAEQLRFVRPGPHVLVTVTDTGHGIPADSLPHIFEPFYTTKQAGRGTGLGLATVYGIVKQSGGSIIAENRPDGGARFSIYLPELRDGSAIPAPAAAGAPALPAASGSETILLVEDDPLVRRLTRDLLRRHGYRVLEERDGEAALERMHGSEHIDLLLTDVVMPKLSGRELVERLPAARRSVPVLYVSGYTDAALPATVDGETTAFLPKPYTPGSLTRTVRKLLDAATGGVG